MKGVLMSPKGKIYLVKCSCGKIITLIFNEIEQRLQASNPSWVKTGDGQWFCGEDGHYQAELSEVE